MKGKTVNNELLGLKVRFNLLGIKLLTSERARGDLPGQLKVTSLAVNILTAVASARKINNMSC